MKKICFNILDINAKGGEERMCSSLANLLAEVGYVVYIASFVSHKNIISFYQISNKVRVVHILGGFFERRINQFFPFIKYAEKKYKDFLRENKIDIIIDVDTDRVPFTSPIVKQLDIKHIAWDHFNYGRFKKRAVSRIILPFLLHDVDKLVVLTKVDENLYHEDAKIPSEKIVQIYNFSSIKENERYEHHTNTILAMGRLSKQKGFDLLIEAWRIISNEVSDWRLKIVGDGDEKQNLLRKIQEYGLQNVILLPATKNPHQEYLQSDIFVLSSRYEGFPLVLLEACAMSLPIVSFDCLTGPNEIIHDGYNGYLVTPNDVEMLAEKLLNLMIDNKKRTKMAQNALESVKQFRTSNILNQWINLIETL